MTLRAKVKERERELIVDALARVLGNQTQAARDLGVSRRTLTNKLNEHGIARPKKTQAVMREFREMTRDAEPEDQDRP